MRIFNEGRLMYFRLPTALPLLLVAFLLSAGPADSAVIKGRIVDSNGRPVAGAEIRVWQKTPLGGARGYVPVVFNGSETLTADEEGRFSTPDLLNARTPIRIVSTASGFLAGHSGWLVPQQELTEVEETALVRLRNVIGQVVDRQGASVARATVFYGDGPMRVEAKTGSTGKFLLENVPENAPFLFAECPEYRLTGVMLGGEEAIVLRLSRSDQPNGPLHTCDPLVSYEERVSLARRLLDPYLEAVIAHGNDTDKYWTLYELSTIDPRAALQWLDRAGFQDPARKDDCRGNIILNWMKRRPTDDWDDISAAIESSAGDSWAGTALMAGAQYYLPQDDPDRRRAWVDEALKRTRSSEPMNRVAGDARTAEVLWRIGDRERAATLAREAEATLKDLSRSTPPSDFVIARLARALAPIDLPATIGWLDQIKNDFQFAQEGGFVALDLASVDAAKAEEMWDHIGGRAANDRAFLTGRDRNAADVCFRVARLDVERARRIADGVQAPFWRLQARGAVALAVRGEMGKALLREAIADRDLKAVVLEAAPFRTPETSALAMAGLLPVAEQLDPAETEELFWRALSLRPTQAAVELLDDELLRADVALAQLIARYKPAVARKLLEPAIQRLVAFASPAEGTQKVRPVIVAAAYVDPNWAVEALHRLPEPPDVSWSRHSKNQARLFLVRMLGLQGSEYWRHAGFWEADD